MINRYSEADFAATLGCPSLSAFRAERASGRIPAPDGVFNKRPYWRRETIIRVAEIQANAINAAWGRPAVTLPADYPIRRVLTGAQCNL